ncbi:MAG: monovalent cation/H(+) antiporter subunit G [Candidatus Sumerlaeia bacterium]|nr:monovalent cation/H(+) antiporter subunit G [Candidatus Sumerlaeia bacterium]
MIDAVGYFFILLGLFFTFTGTLGIVRFKDVYLRLHAATKSLTFGFTFFVFGAGLLTHDPNAIAKTVLIVAFQFLTSPLSAQMIARAAVLRGIKPLRQSAGNDQAPILELQEHASKGNSAS